MKTKIFCDSADFTTIKNFNNNSLVSGFTTNPSLMRLSGAKNYKNYSLKLLNACKKKPISLEVFGDTFHQMLAQANIINSWGKNVYVKIPVVNSQGFFCGKVINKLSNKGVKLNITAVYTVNQVKKIKKTQTTDECIQAIQNLRKHGIESHAFIMVGFPDETEETFKQTMDFIPELNPDGIIFSIFTPYPGSDIYNECKDKGIIEGDFDLVLYNHQSPLNCFTKNIPKERFYELRQKAFKYVDSYNSKAKFRRGVASLTNLGFKATWKRVYRHFYSKYLNLTIAKTN